jgi:3-phenylpropionate/trans-cinnamate dioxygenase ferredoxin subunit
MSRYVVGRVEDIPEGGRKIVEVAGRSVGVFNVDGEFFALLNRCPHKGAELCSSGTIFGISHAETPSDPIDYQPRRSLRCPWHAWEFDIRTGESFYDPENDRVRKYDVSVLAGSELCGTADGNSPAYVLEGYEVEIDDDVVVVNTSRRRAGVGPAARSESVA